MGGDRPLGKDGWNVWRGIIGAFYLASAVFNAAFTLPRTGEDDLFEGYADGAWFGFLADFMRDVFAPNGALFMVPVIVFEVVVGFLILSHLEWVDYGVVASLLWVVAIMPFLAWPYLLVNIILFVAQGVLLLRRFDTDLWSRATSALRSRGRPHTT